MNKTVEHFEELNDLIGVCEYEIKNEGHLRRREDCGEKEARQMCANLYETLSGCELLVQQLRDLCQ